MMTRSPSDKAFALVSADDNEDEQQRSLIRTRAAELVPELDSYRWADNYFKDSGEEAIIAGFDHDAVVFIQEQIGEICSCLLWLAYLLWIFASVVSSNPGFGWLFAIIIASLLGPWISALTMSWLFPFWTGLFPPAHTAVTAQGVLHVMGVGLYNRCASKFLIPFGDIDVIQQQPLRLEGVVVSTTANLQLKNNLSTYYIGAGHRLDLTKQTIALKHLCRTSWFVDLVMALKNENSTTTIDATDDKPLDSHSMVPLAVGVLMGTTECGSDSQQVDDPLPSQDPNNSIV